MPDLFNLDAAESAVAFEVEGLCIVGVEGFVVLDACKRRLEGMLDCHVVADPYLHAAKAAFDIDDGTVEDVGAAQVEAYMTCTLAPSKVLPAKE